MKTKPDYITIAALPFWSSVIVFSLLQTASGQGFANLNFEQASVAPAPANYTPSDAADPISAASAFPGWTVNEDGIVCTAVWGGPYALDETSVALISGVNNPIQGNYSAELTAYADAPSNLYHNSSISQTGFVPIGTQSIQFLIENPFPSSGIGANPTVTLNGTPINLQEISQSGDVAMLAGNVSEFAGTIADLSILCQATQGGGFPANENNFILDDIQFSTTAVPEPNSFGLFALGGLFLAWRHRKARTV